MPGAIRAPVNNDASIAGDNARVAWVGGSDEVAMPWTAHDYPVSMRHLSGPVREKAIEIANALLVEGMDEGKAIRIAIARAKEWARHRGLPWSDADAWGFGNPLG